jgi:hypothetical protein
MSISTGAVDNGRATLSPSFLDFCAKVRNNHPSILPPPGKPFKIYEFSDREHIELADALLDNNSVTYLKLIDIDTFTKSSAEAMANYVRTSKRLQRIHWPNRLKRDHRELVLRHREEILCCFLPALQESTSLKELDMVMSFIGGPPSLAFEHMLTHIQSLRSLTLTLPVGLPGEDIAVAAARSGLKKNTTLRELTLETSFGASIDVSSIFTSLHDHPLLRRLCLSKNAVDLTGLETVWLRDTSKITELDIHRFYGGAPRKKDLTHVLQALGRHPKLTKLGLRSCYLSHDEARLLRMTLCNIPSLQSLVLRDISLERVGLAKLAPALYHNTSIKDLDLSGNNLNCTESAEILRDILRRNKTLTTLDLSRTNFWYTTAVNCIAEGLDSNSTLLNIDLSSCSLRDYGVSTLARNLGSRTTTLQKLTLGNNSITATGVGVLIETMEQNSNRIRDLDLRYNTLIENEGARFLARSLGNNALPSLTRLYLAQCGIGDDGFIALMSALQQNTSLLHLDLSDNHGLSERAFLTLAESLPEIKVLQRIDICWSTGLASAMLLLLAGLRKNSSLSRFHVANCALYSVPPSPEDTSRFAGGWMQEVERLGYRNHFLPLIHEREERLPPRGVWPHALAQVATLPVVIFEVLRSKPSLVP